MPVAHAPSPAMRGRSPPCRRAGGSPPTPAAARASAGRVRTAPAEGGAAVARRAGGRSARARTPTATADRRTPGSATVRRSDRLPATARRSSPSRSRRAPRLIPARLARPSRGGQGRLVLERISRPTSARDRRHRRGDRHHGRRRARCRSARANCGRTAGLYRSSPRRCRRPAPPADDITTLDGAQGLPGHHPACRSTPSRDADVGVGDLAYPLDQSSRPTPGEMPAGRPVASGPAASDRGIGPRSSRRVSGRPGRSGTATSHGWVRRRRHERCSAWSVRSNGWAAGSVAAGHRRPDGATLRCDRAAAPPTARVPSPRS